MLATRLRPPLFYRLESRLIAALATRDSRDQHAEKEKTRGIVTRGDVGIVAWGRATGVKVKKKKRCIKLTRNE